MGDVSVIARRLENGKIQCAWSGNGGYLSNVGSILLTYYNSPEMVEKLFSFGQIARLGIPAAIPENKESGIMTFLIRLQSMFNGEDTSESFITDPKTVFATEVTGEPLWIVDREEDAAAQIHFTDFVYFYDTDKHWYYTDPHTPAIRIPLETFYSMSLRDRDMVGNKTILDLKVRLIRQLFNEFIPSQPELMNLFSERNITPEVLKDRIISELSSASYSISEYRWLWDNFNDYFLAVPTEDFTEIERFDISMNSGKTAIERLDLSACDCSELRKELRAQLLVKNILARTLASFYITLEENRQEDDPDTIDYIAKLMSDDFLEGFIDAYFERFISFYKVDDTDYVFELSGYERSVLAKTMAKHITDGIDFEEHKIKEGSILEQFKWK